MVSRVERVRVGSAERIQFVPRSNGSGGLVVWRKPILGHRYVIGADAAEGIDATGGTGSPDPDYSVAQVLDVDTGEQVARLRLRVEPAAFADWLTDLGSWYNGAFLTPEANGPGIAVLEGLLRNAYPPRLIYQRTRTADDRRPPLLQELGWKTTVASKPQLISVLDRALRDMSVIVNDPLTMNELHSFSYLPNGRMAAEGSGHDDLVIALALAVVGLEAMPRDAVVASARRPKAAPYAVVGRRERQMHETEIF